ncbi:MAG: hypothetical protein EOO07_36865 [Chitinophagaceae bacterium]|nr:MAG: hypothetical protein EOO07_36865 [Chitinophagaceae bacterium]
MLEGFKLDLNNIGFFFWFILLGLLTVIFSIVHRPEYVFLGACISLYGMLAFLVDLLFDRICGRVLKKTFSGDNAHQITIFGHVLRFGAQAGLVCFLVYIVNAKYSFFQL